MADFVDFSDIEERLKDPYNRIMVMLRLSAMIEPFTLEKDELDSLVADVVSLMYERDALKREAGAVAGVVAAAHDLVSDVYMNESHGRLVHLADVLSGALAALEPDKEA